MAKIEWDESCLLGVKEIDDQHAKLVGMINQLHEVSAKGQDAALAARVATELSNYTQYHFSAEEQLMQNAGYKDLKAHIRQHKLFSSKAVDFLLGVVQDRQSVSEDMLDYLSDWLMGHIKVTDRKFGAFIKEQQES